MSPPNGGGRTLAKSPANSTAPPPPRDTDVATSVGGPADNATTARAETRRLPHGMVAVIITRPVTP